MTNLKNKHFQISLFFIFSSQVEQPITFRVARGLTASIQKRTQPCSSACTAKMHHAIAHKHANRFAELISQVNTLSANWLYKVKRILETDEVAVMLFQQKVRSGRHQRSNTIIFYVDNYKYWSKHTSREHNHSDATTFQ